MITPLVLIILIPFIGTSLGAASVYFLGKNLSTSWNQALSGYSAGIMTASAFWSLILPSIEQSNSMLPAIIGIWAGFLLLMVLEHSIAQLFIPCQKSMLVLAITLHNIPEGIAVGIVAANWLRELNASTYFSTLALSAGIALQNIPEGAIVSSSLRCSGQKRSKAFAWGVFSGAVEPLGGLCALILATLIIPILPYFLGLAGGAMLYVVVKELIPEMNSDSKTWIGSVCFAAGFTTMALLDRYLG